MEESGTCSNSLSCIILHECTWRSIANETCLNFWAIGTPNQKQKFKVKTLQWYEKQSIISKGVDIMWNIASLCNFDTLVIHSGYRIWYFFDCQSRIIELSFVISMSKQQKSPTKIEAKNNLYFLVYPSLELFCFLGKGRHRHCCQFLVKLANKTFLYISELRKNI